QILYIIHKWGEAKNFTTAERNKSKCKKRKNTRHFPNIQTITDITYSLALGKFRNSVSKLTSFKMYNGSLNIFLLSPHYVSRKNFQPIVATVHGTFANGTKDLRFVYCQRRRQNYK